MLARGTRAGKDLRHWLCPTGLGHHPISGPVEVFSLGHNDLSLSSDVGLEGKDRLKVTHFDLGSVFEKAVWCLGYCWWAWK